MHLRERPRRREVERAGAKHIAAPQFGEQAGLHAQSHSPVPEAIRSMASVRNYIKVRKRGLHCRALSCPLSGSELRASGVRFGPIAAHQVRSSPLMGAAALVAPYYWANEMGMRE